MNKGIVKLSVGALLVILAILLLQKFVEILELDIEFMVESFNNWREFLPYLVLGMLSGFVGFYLFFRGLREETG